LTPGRIRDGVYKTSQELLTTTIRARVPYHVFGFAILSQLYRNESPPSLFVLKFFVRCFMNIHAGAYLFYNIWMDRPFSYFVEYCSATSEARDRGHKAYDVILITSTLAIESPALY